MDTITLRQAWALAEDLPGPGGKGPGLGGVRGAGTGVRGGVRKRLFPLPLGLGGRIGYNKGKAKPPEKKKPASGPKGEKIWLSSRSRRIISRPRC